MTSKHPIEAAELSDPALAELQADEDIPTLTEVVVPGRPEALAATPENLPAELSARVLELAEELVDHAVRELQATLREQVCDQLRARLPELIDDILRARLK